jgi:hypothetical protein
MGLADRAGPREEKPMSTTISDRIGAATGAAFVVLAMVGNEMASGSSQSARPTGEQVLSDVARQASSTTYTVGFVLEGLAFVAFIGFLGYLAYALRRARGRGPAGIAAGAALVSGAVMLAVKLGSVAPLGALAIDHAHMSPQLALVLNDLSGVAFIICWLPFAIFVAATAAALHRAGLVGRPTTYIGFALGAIGLALSIAGVYEPAGANPLAFLLGLAWLLAVSVRLAVRPGRNLDPGPASGPASGGTAEARVVVSA